MKDFYEDAGAYLLGALSPQEAQEFERAMEEDPELRAEVESLRVAVDALPSSPLQMTVPPDLKGRIMAVVNSEAELLRAAGPEADRPAPPRRRGLALPGWLSLRPGLALAACLLVLVIGAGIGGVLASNGTSNDQQVVVDAVLGEAQLIERKEGHSTLTATDLDPAGSGYVYQVWLQRGTDDPKPTNALFGARHDGTASVDVPGSLEGVDKVLVTKEPQGGSDVPTSAPIIEVRPA